MSIVLTLQSGLRNVAVGADTYAYLLKFEEVFQYWSWNNIWEYFNAVYVDGEGKDAGFALLQKVFQIFSNDYRLFLIAIAILFFVAFGQFVYRNTTTMPQVIFAFILYLALFYEFYSITGIRQTIAGALCIFGFKYIQDRKLMKFLICIGIAYFIHKTALIFLPFYFIAVIKQKYIYIPSFVAFVVIMMYRNAVAALVVSSSDDQRVAQYFTTQWEGAGTYVFTAMLVMVFLWGLLNIKALSKDKNNFSKLNAISLALVFTPLTWLDPSLMRLVMYYSIFLAIFIPLSIDKASIPKSVKNSIVFFGIMLLSYFAIAKNQNYAFFWDDMKLSANYGIEKVINK